MITPALRAEVERLTDRSTRISYRYRVVSLTLLLGTILLYLTPIPSYISGTHSQMHYTMFHGKHVGTLDDLTYLPALPFYLLFLAIQGTVLAALIWEVADLMGVRWVVSKRKRYEFPAQPHAFGTAPDIVVETLSTMKWAPGKPLPDGTRPPQQLVMKTVPPRLMYVFLLWILLLPMPLMVFGAGSNDNAVWWSVSSITGLITFLSERSIAASERQIRELSGTSKSLSTGVRDVAG